MNWISSADASLYMQPQCVALKKEESGMAMVFHGDHITFGQCLRKQLMTLEIRTSLTLGLQLATELANVTNTCMQIH